MGMSLLAPCLFWKYRRRRSRAVVHSSLVVLYLYGDWRGQSRWQTTVKSCCGRRPDYDANLGWKRTRRIIKNYSRRQASKAHTGSFKLLARSLLFIQTLLLMIKYLQESMHNRLLVHYVVQVQLQRGMIQITPEIPNAVIERSVL